MQEHTYLGEHGEGLVRPPTTQGGGAWASQAFLVISLTRSSKVEVWAGGSPLSPSPKRD